MIPDRRHARLSIGTRISTPGRCGMASSGVLKRSRSEPAAGRSATRDSVHAEEIRGVTERRYVVGWQVYLKEWDCWKSYTPLQTGQLEAAWHSEAAFCELSDEEGHDCWRVCFVSMAQCNTASGTRRPVQRILITHR